MLILFKRDLGNKILTRMFSTDILAILSTVMVREQSDSALSFENSSVFAVLGKSHVLPAFTLVIRKQAFIALFKTYEEGLTVKLKAKRKASLFSEKSKQRELCTQTPSLPNTDTFLAH